MSPEIAKLIDILERKLKLLHDLAEELGACRSAFVSMDLDAIYMHIAEQTRICQKLKLVEEERAMAWNALATSPNEPMNGGTLSSWVGSLEPIAGSRLRRVLTALAVAEGEIRHLNHTHSVLLDGTRRTLQILGNAMATLAPIYGPPPVWTETRRTDGHP